MSNTQEGAIAQKEVEVKEITISGVKELLAQGLDRKQIAKHFDKSVAEMARTVWSHPKLKNLKKKSAPTVVLIDDEVAETAVESVEDVADNATKEVEQANTPTSPASGSQWQ